ELGPGLARRLADLEVEVDDPRLAGGEPLELLAAAVEEDGVADEVAEDHPGVEGRPLAGVAGVDPQAHALADLEDAVAVALDPGAGRRVVDELVAEGEVRAGEALRGDVDRRLR